MIFLNKYPKYNITKTTMGIFSSLSGMGVLGKGLDMAKDIFGDSKEKPSSGTGSTPETGNPLFNWLKEKMGFKRDAESIRKTAETERAGLLQEIGGSVIRRMFPRAAKWLDLGRLITGKWGKEGHPLQNEIAGFTAFSAILPDFALKIFTDIFAKSEYFQKMVEWGPMLPDAMKEECKKAARGEDYDPDKVIEVIRILNQDIGLALTGVDQVTKGVKLT